MKLTGEIRCKECNNLLEWEYIVHQNIHSAKLDIEVINTQIYHPIKLANENGYYLFEIQCKNCNIVNRFQVPKL